MTEKHKPNNHVDKHPKNMPNKAPPPPDIFSYKKHSMDYFTVNGVILRTGYADKKYWYILCIKELLDNGVDFLWKYYQGYIDTNITVCVTKNDSLLHIKIRNTNSRNIPIFQHLDLIFDPDMRYGSKQNEKVISRGMLGDAMKQLLALAYVLIHSGDDGTAFTNKQWNKPLIIRCNGRETHVRIIVDKSKQMHSLDVKEIKLVDTHDTEIEIFLPQIVDLDIHDIESFCRVYPLLTTDVSFKFRLVDNSTDKPSEVQEVDSPIPAPTPSEGFQKTLVQALSNPARKAAKEIEYPALHAISTKWNNTCSIHSLMPEEFITMVTSVYDQASVTLYDVLQRLREGNNMPKTDENQISIAKFLSDPTCPKKLKQIFLHLKKLLDPAKVLSLPYTDVKERKQSLVARVCNLYPHLDAEKATFKVVRGFYDDKGLKKIWSKAEIRGESEDLYTIQQGKGILQYPFAIEFLVIPYKTSALDTDKASKFIGSVNYSLSPRTNEFDGDYSWDDKHNYRVTATSMTNILKTYGFKFHEFASAKTKIPSVIIVNIISPRVDYHGHDKSRIDTHAFGLAIIEAAKKISGSVQSFSAAGFVFYKERHHGAIPEAKKSKLRPEDVVREFILSRKKGEHDNKCQ